MRDYAIQSGLAWAAGNTELLRLGPAAIGTLAAVHLKQDTYKGLTKDASFKAKDVVALAQFAKDQHIDANKLGGAFGKAEKEMTPEERARFNGALVPYMADSKNPEKHERAARAFDEAEKAHPEKQKELRELREQLHLKSEKLDRDNKVAAEKDRQSADKDSRAIAEASRAAGKQNGATDQLAALDALEPEPKAKAPTTDNKDKPKSAPPAAPTPKVQPKAAAPAPH